MTSPSKRDEIERLEREVEACREHHERTINKARQQRDDAHEALSRLADAVAARDASTHVRDTMTYRWTGDAADELLAAHRAARDLLES